MSPNKPIVLVVDDEIANLTVFVLLCKDLYTVHGVRTVAEAAQVRQAHAIDLAIIDHRLGNQQTGLALFEELTCSKILLSDDADMATWASEHGGEAWRKPIDFLVVKKRLRALAATFGTAG